MASLEEPEAGLQQRYQITHLENPGKHQGCEYFVLDLTHDQLARRTAEVYALLAEENGLQKLADDLRAKIEQLNREDRYTEELRKLRMEKDDDFFNE